MAKKKIEAEKDELIVDVEQVYSKTEDFINENQNVIIGVVGGLIAIVVAFYAYNRVYLGPLEEEANGQMFMAEQYFQKDSFDLALNGDGNYLGFLDVADEYSNTSAGNLAHYYAGVCYLRSGSYESAIEELKSFDGAGEMLSSVALGATGDAYMELNNTDEALSYYEKAADASENDFTSPVYLQKAGFAAEKAGKFDKAIDYYTQVKEKYPTSNEGRNAEKYIARAEANLN
ncbi:MAG: soluble NSF attachment family protein [Flavobacteriales bacterium]|nr:soluble NSF attachment family protein [Flavobacteriales bacterium]